MTIPNAACVDAMQCEALDELKEYGENSTNDTMDETPDDSQSGSLTWVVHGFSQLGTDGIRSDKFKAGDYNWRVLLFPKGHKESQGRDLSIFLEICHDDLQLRYGWSVFVHCFFGIYNHNEQRITIQQEYRHKFSAICKDWGFVSFVALGDIFDLTKGFLLDNSLTFVARVQICLDYSDYDSKKETGFVGLKNQGATCYLNSLLQTLYHIPYFRKALYRMPTGHISSSNRIPMALQSLFYNMQNNNHSVSTEDLTASFGWNPNDTLLQHDVQELNRLLCEKLEDKMRGTVVEGTIQKLFEGHQMNYIECIDVDSKSTRKESFYDLQLDVKGCKDVYDSFDKYIQVEKLDGDNKYQSDQFGLQDAQKGVLFVDFPPVLQLHLKRFEYDASSNSMIKINDRYEFPLQLDLDKDNGRYLSPDADRSVCNVYSLYSVLVHSGGANGGHYYAFIRPLLCKQWYKFDDERVTKEHLNTVLEEQYGGEGEIPQKNLGVNCAIKFMRCSNAYMLVYVRESDKDTIMCNIEDTDITEHLKETDRKRKELEEIHLYKTIKVVSDSHLHEQVGKDVYFDLVDFDKVQSLRILKNNSLLQIKDLIAKIFGIPSDHQKFWVWNRRRNCTCRPNKPLKRKDEFRSIEDLIRDAGGTELRLFVEERKCLIPEPLSPVAEEDILLFFKLYDPEKEKLQYIGRQFVKLANRPFDDLENFKKMSGFSADEKVEIYEEISYHPEVKCGIIDVMATYKENKLIDGDIICLQRSVDGMNDLRYPSVTKFFEHLKTRQVVHFRKLEKPEEDAFCLELEKSSTYDEVVAKLAQYVELDDSSKIRLTPHNGFADLPAEQPIKFQGARNLVDMLAYCNQMSDTLYYEILDMPLRELEELKVFKVSFYNSRVQEVSVLTIMLPSESTVGDIIRHIRGKVEMSHHQAELRILQISGHKICKILPESKKIKHILGQHPPFHFTYRAEEVLEEEKSKDPGDCLIHVYHFRRDCCQKNNLEIFGEPFLFLTKSGETLSQLKDRIKKKLEVPDDKFSKFKFAYVHLSNPEYLSDDDVVVKYFEKKSVYGPWENYLGVENNDYSWRQPHQLSQVTSQAHEKPMKIYN